MSKEELNNLQDKIIEKNKKYNKILLIVDIILISVILIIILSNNVTMASIIMCLTFITIIIIMGHAIKMSILGNDINIFNKNYKNIYVKTSLESIFDDLVYDTNRGFIERDLLDKRIIKTYDIYYSNDYIKGKYNGVLFEQADVLTKEIVYKEEDDGTKKKEEEIRFSGKIIEVEFNKRFKENILVYTKFFDSSIIYSDSWLSRVKMDNDIFNKEFIVNSNNVEETYYILTPHFMERLLNINNSLKCPLMFNFKDNKLYILMDNGYDSFEVNPFKKINESEIIESITKDIKVITNFVDELKLDSKLFKEE